MTISASFLDTTDWPNNFNSIFVRVNLHIQQIVSDFARANWSQWMYGYFLHWKCFWSTFCIICSRRNKRKIIGHTEITIKSI